MREREGTIIDYELSDVTTRRFTKMNNFVFFYGTLLPQHIPGRYAWRDR